jgi:uncharacterized protein YndB with AHSA1/START domain
MKQQPLVVERTYDASVSRVWQAITNRDEMEKWYFNLAEFRPETGFEFSFTGGPDGRQYKHHCRVTEVVPERKISYTWCYEGYPGESEVSFELFAEGDKTRLKLTHAGLDTFPANNTDFAAFNFNEGWNSILGTSLKKYLEPGQ